MVPTSCAAKVKLAGENCAIGVVPMPKHVISTDCGLAGTLSVKSKEADKFPVRVGEQLTETVQLPPEARLVPQLFATKLNWLAFAPPKLTEPMTRDVDAKLVIVTS